MIAITEDQVQIKSALEADLRANTDAARLVCDQVHYISDVKTRHCEEVLAFAPGRETRASCAWIGYSPTSHKYVEVYEAKKLTSEEEKSVLRLAVDAARQVAAAYMVVDVVQTAHDRWIVIELGDAQFAGPGCAPVMQMSNRLQRAADDVGEP